MSDGNSLDRFKNQNIVIFGGTTGIGYQTMVEFIENGANYIAVAGRHEWKWKHAKDNLIEKYNHRVVEVDGKYMDRYINDLVVVNENLLKIKNRTTVEYIQCDVRLEFQVRFLLDYVIKKMKYINVFFNNAGVQPIIGNGDGDDITKLNFESGLMEDGGIFYRIPPAKKDEICSTPISDYCENPIATTVFGTFYCLKWEMYHAFRQEDVPVSIINTISRNGVNIPSANRPIYAASKAFVHSLTQTIATQAAIKSQGRNNQVRINCIAPGPIQTPLEIPLYIDTLNIFGKYGLTLEEGQQFHKKASVGVPLGRPGYTLEVAKAVLFLADHNQSSYITGSTITIDGGYTASPII